MASRSTQKAKAKMKIQNFIVNHTNHGRIHCPKINKKNRVIILKG